MASSSASETAVAPHLAGTIIDAVVKVSVDATRPLPLACALYAVENPEGIWLCAYYGSNKSVFDYLPQKGAEIDETTAGIVLQHKVFVAKEQFPTEWEKYKKERFMMYGAHSE